MEDTARGLSNFITLKRDWGRSEEVCNSPSMIKGITRYEPMNRRYSVSFAFRTE